MGDEPAAAAAPAARQAGGSPFDPIKAAAAPGAATTVGATAVNATLAAEIVDALPTPSSVTRTAAPTTAISIARRYSRRMYALPDPASGRGTRTAVRSSP